MRLRDFAVIGIGAMVLFQVVTAFASIRLLTRMSPAIEHILSENVASNTAAEDMLICLIEDDDPALRRRRFRDALTRARNNITEPGEAALLDAVESQMNAAQAGDTAAATAIAETLRALSHLNRLSMRTQDEEAKRIGYAGAWAMAGLGIVGFLAGAFVIRRMVRNVIAPVEEIRRVLSAQVKDDPMRRLVLRRAAPDLRDIESLINRVIDMRSSDDIRAKRDQERAALLHLLDREQAPWVLLSPEGELLAANRTAEDQLANAEKDTALSINERISEKEGWEIISLTGGARLAHSSRSNR